MVKNRVYIDALSIAGSRMSGVGHVALETIRALHINKDFNKKYEMRLVVPLFKSRVVKERVPGVKIALVPLPARIMNGLLKINLLPPLDLFLGKGIYLFPNYRNWPLLFSRSVTYIHDFVYPKYQDFMEEKNKKYLAKGLSRWIGRTDVVVVFTDYVKGELEEHYPGKRTVVVSHGINQDSFNKSVSKKTARSTVEKYGIAASNFVLYIGNIEPRKNLDMLIRSFDKLPKDLKDKHPLVIVGGGGWNNDGTKLLIQDGVKKGYILAPNKYVTDEDLPSFYRMADVLVQPAFYEGFGLSPLQAIACGTRVVVSDIPTFKEVLSIVDKGVMFVDPNNTEAWTKVLKKELNNEQGVSHKRLPLWSDAAVSLVSIFSQLTDKAES